EPLRPPLSPLGVQLRVRLPGRSSAHARPVAPLHRRRAARRVPHPHGDPGGRMKRRLAPLLFLLAPCAACIGTTGSDLVTFEAFAAGPADANGQPLTFTNGRGWSITLTKAQLRIGAVYLNRSVPVSGGQE